MLRWISVGTMLVLAAGTFIAWRSANFVPSVAFAAVVEPSGRNARAAVEVESVHNVTFHLKSGRSLTIWLDRTNAPDSTRAFVLSCAAGAYRDAALIYDSPTLIEVAGLDCDGALHAPRAIGAVTTGDRGNGVSPARGSIAFVYGCSGERPINHSFTIELSDAPREVFAPIFACVVAGLDELTSALPGQESTLDCIESVTLTE